MKRGTSAFFGLILVLACGSMALDASALTIQGVLLTKSVLAQKAAVRNFLAQQYGVNPNQAPQIVANGIAAVLHLGVLPPNNIGSGTLGSSYSAAVAPWKQVLSVDANETVYYAYANVGGEVTYVRWNGLSQTWYTIILINNDGLDGHFAWYLSPDPLKNTEYQSSLTITANLSGGVINTGRCLINGTGAAADLTHVNLEEVFIHSLGHSLLLSVSNPYFQPLVASDGSYDVIEPLYGAGSRIPAASNNFGYTSHIDPVPGKLDWAIMASIRAGTLCYPSSADALAVASLEVISTNAGFAFFTGLNVNPNPTFWAARVSAASAVAPSNAPETQAMVAGSAGVPANLDVLAQKYPAKQLESLEKLQ